MSNTYNISVTYEVVTDESAEQGDVAERGYEREREDFDENEVQRLVREYGFSEPSSTRLEDRMWFSSTRVRAKIAPTSRKANAGSFLCICTRSMANRRPWKTMPTLPGWHASRCPS